MSQASTEEDANGDEGTIVTLLFQREGGDNLSASKTVDYE
jgi:hypothetical protein